MNKRFFFILLVGFFMAAAGHALAEVEITYSGPPITIRVSSYLPPAAPAYLAHKPAWDKDLEKKSKGKLVAKNYMGGVLHSSRDGFKAINANITDMTEGFPAYNPGSFQLLHATDLPFFCPTAVVGGMVAEQLTPKFFKKEYEKMGVYMAANIIITPYNILSKRPVRKLEDLKGLKIRSGGGLHSDLWKTLGAAPVFLPSPEVYSSFQRGIVDAIAWNDSAFMTYRLYEIGKYRTELNINTVGCAKALNPKFFDNLPKDLKKLFYNELRRLAQLEAAAYDDQSEIGRGIMQKAGIEFITLPPAEFERWRVASKSISDAFIARNEALGLPAKQLLKEIGELTKKYSSWTREQLLESATKNPIQGIIGF